MDARTSQMICSTLPTSDMIRCEVVARASWINALMTRLAIEVSVQLRMRACVCIIIISESLAMNVRVWHQSSMHQRRDEMKDIDDCRRPYGGCAGESISKVVVERAKHRSTRTVERFGLVRGLLELLDDLLFERRCESSSERFCRRVESRTRRGARMWRCRGAAVGRDRSVGALR